MSRNLTDIELIEIDKLQRKLDYDESKFKLKTSELKLKYKKINISDGDLSKDEIDEITILKLSYEYALNILAKRLAELRMNCDVYHYARIDHNGKWIDRKGNELVKCQNGNIN